MKSDYFQLFFYWLPYFLILIVTIYYIRKSPIEAVIKGGSLTNEQEKDRAKRNLFLLLFSLRGSPLHYDFVGGLNKIDVVFQDTTKVLLAWRTLYDSYGNKTQANAEKNWELLRVELLSEMALHLGYGDLKQVNIQRFYYPEGHENQYQSDSEYRKLKINLYQSGIEVNRLLTVQLKSNLGLLGDDSEDKPQ